MVTKKGDDAQGRYDKVYKRRRKEKDVSEQQQQQDGSEKSGFDRKGDADKIGASDVGDGSKATEDNKLVVLRRSTRDKKPVIKSGFQEELDELFPQNKRKRSSSNNDAEESGKTRPSTSTTKRSLTDDKGNPLSVMCHQCQRNDKGRVVVCGTCKWKRYCVPCMTTWYPKMTEDDFAKLCPVCRVNCNCKSCLRLEVRKEDKKMFDLKFTDEEKIQYSKYTIPMLLPFLKQFNKEQMAEKQVEAGIQGLPLSKLEVKRAKCGIDERIYCDNCKTSIADFHRSCSNCQYDLCLICCKEVRDGCLQLSKEEVDVEFVDPGSKYVHGIGDPISRPHRSRPVKLDKTSVDSQWKPRKSDAVNVLTHVQEVAFTSAQKAEIEKLKKKQVAQDEREIFQKQVANCKVEKREDRVGEMTKKISKSEEGLGCNSENGKEENERDGNIRKQNHVNEQDVNEDNIVEGMEHPEGGALWDIFRRQDTPKLEEYIRKYYREFRHIYCRPLDQVVHPIHDQTFYLTTKHKRRLKEQYGVEPWTFVQKLGDAVFIPVGCPHQVRNIKSCIKVALDFVSPENVHECVRLAEDFRTLPPNHRAKEDKLEVKKISLYAMENAVQHLEKKAGKGKPEAMNGSKAENAEQKRRKNLNAAHEGIAHRKVRGSSVSTMGILDFAHQL
ncbi:hypothetical protein POM88_035264 [Heracleum sosnowskyi]|uniref:JmjC domain-containing protein n=1 Tax=Heracleum sosnowskyi TaxID=360622 RepID=A0AAD8HKW3_9APIA|nr:hypothetical protein POM88_035264 [Heracleum sosnowskyi]